MRYAALAALAVMSCGIAQADETVYLKCSVHWGFSHPALPASQSGDAVLNVTVNAWTTPEGIGLSIRADSADKAPIGILMEKPAGGRTVTTAGLPAIAISFIDTSSEKAWSLDAFDKALEEHEHILIDRTNGVFSYGEEPTAKESGAGATRTIMGTCEKADPPKLKF